MANRVDDWVNIPVGGDDWVDVSTSTPVPVSDPTPTTPEPEIGRFSTEGMFPTAKEYGPSVAGGIVTGPVKGFMRLGRAVLGAPSVAVRQAGMVRQWGWAEEVLREKDPTRQAKLRKGMSESKKSFDATAKALGEAQDWHQQGVETILRNHPEWETEPPESFIDLVKSPDKLAVAIAEAAPLLVAAGILTAAGQPSIAAGLMYVSEGQEASDQAIADGASEDEAAIAYGVYGIVAGALETMQLKGIIKVAKGSYNALLNRTVQKVAKGGLRTAAWGTIKTAAQEALEEMSQGAWGELTAKMVYDKDVPGGVAGFIDRRAQEAYIGGVMGLIPGVAGGVAGRAAGRAVDAPTEVPTEVPVEAQAPTDIPPGSNVYQTAEGRIVVETPQDIGTEAPTELRDGRVYERATGEELMPVTDGTVSGRLDAPQVAAVAVGEEVENIRIFNQSETGEVTFHDTGDKATIDTNASIKAAQELPSDLNMTVLELSDRTQLISIDVGDKGKGVGTQGLQWLVDKADRSQKPIELDVSNQNTDAIRLYGRMGFIQTGQEGTRVVMRYEPQPPVPLKPPKITRKKALTLGHTLPDLLEWGEAQRREFMQQTVGTTTMKGMKLADMRILVEALQGEVRAAGLEYIPPTPPVDELVETLQAKKITELEPAEELKAGRIRQLGRRIKSGAYSFVTGLERMERFFESLDAHKKGAFSKHIWEPVRQADELSTENANQDLDEFMGYLEDQGVDTALWLGKMEQIGNTRWELTPFQKIGTYMLAQNKNGRRQLTKGMGMSKNDLAQIAGAMTPQETATAEWLLEKYDQQWGVIKAVAVQSGMDPAKLKKELRYSPIMRTDADLETQEDFLSGIIEGFTGEKYDPEHKFLEERKPSAAGKVELDAAILYMHNIARTNRFIQFASTANSIGKILNNRKFKQALNERTYGQGSRLINKWMKDSVRGTTAHTTGWLSKAANVMRHNGIVYAIGYNIPSSLRQSLSLSNAVAVDKAMLVHVPANLTRAATPKGYNEMQEFVYSRSLQVKNASYDRDLRTKANKAGLKLKLRGKRQWSQKAISWIRWMDRHTRVVAWKSLYDTGMGKFNDEAKAMEYADKWVARTQPMANMKDLPDFFRGGTFEKLLTTFQNQVNNNANFYIYDILGAKKAGEITNTEAAHRVMFSYVLPAVLFGMIGRGGLPKDVKQIAVDLATYPLAGVVVLGRWVTRMIRGWGGSTTIAGVAPEEAGKLVGAAKRGDIPNIIKRAVTTVGAATGRIPAQAIRTAEGVADIAAGETEDPRRLIWSEWALKQGKKKKKKSRYGGGYLR